MEYPHSVKKGKMPSDKKIWGIQLINESDEVEKLVHGVYREIVRRPVNLNKLIQALMNLLEYLASSGNRTTKNCKAVDLFFCVRDQWEADWTHLPSCFQCILDDMGGSLHDSVESPGIAEDFESTPEHLLKRVKEIQL